MDTKPPKTEKDIRRFQDDVSPQDAGSELEWKEITWTNSERCRGK